MLVIEYSVVIVTCTVFVLWLFVSRHVTQQALFWWNSKQWMRMSQEAEAIRNGLLQESFIIRRHLELSEVNRFENQSNQDQHYLATIEKLHYSLKNLSDYLSPAHIDDSLPLAIRHLLEIWKSRIPALNLEMELSTDWHHESHSVSRVILMALEELLQITLSDIPSSVSIFVSLKPQRHQSELIVGITNLNVSNLTLNYKLAELDNLRRAFKFLTSGECVHRSKDNTETWYFRWQCLQTNFTKRRSHPLNVVCLPKKQP